jgi:hypothetical protein
MANFGSNSISEEWRYPVADLIVSPERAAWIVARYPETDMGRPGVFADSHRRAGQVRIPDVGVDLDRNEESEGGAVAAGYGEPN